MFLMFDDTVCQKVLACLSSYSQRETVIRTGYTGPKFALAYFTLV